MVSSHEVVVDGKVQCRMCEKRYSCAANLRKHVRKVHVARENCTSHLCVICGRGYNEKYRLNEHIKDVHKNGVFSCSLCNKKFKQRRNLLRHKRDSHE